MRLMVFGRKSFYSWETFSDCHFLELKQKYSFSQIFTNDSLNDRRWKSVLMSFSVMHSFSAFLFPPLQTYFFRPLCYSLSCCLLFAAAVLGYGSFVDLPVTQQNVCLCAIAKRTPTRGQPLLQHIVVDSGNQMYRYDRMEPMIFIGGMPRSGTTLARVLVDAHPDIRCGEETRVLPRLLQMRSQWVKSQKEKMRLEEAGVTNEVVVSIIPESAHFVIHPFSRS